MERDSINIEALKYKREELDKKYFKKYKDDEAELLTFADKQLSWTRDLDSKFKKNLISFEDYIRLFELRKMNYEDLALYDGDNDGIKD